MVLKSVQQYCAATTSDPAYGGPIRRPITGGVPENGTVQIRKFGSLANILPYIAKCLRQRTENETVGAEAFCFPLRRHPRLEAQQRTQRPEERKWRTLDWRRTLLMYAVL
eukprot:2773283-Rhodomonas_salina.2